MVAPAIDAISIRGRPGEGLTVAVGDGFSLNIRSRVQVRYQLALSSPSEDGSRDVNQIVNIGTARLWLSGNVFREELTYMIQLAVAGRDFRDEAVSPIFDAYVDWRAHRDLNLRLGQFFVPFDRLRTVREWALQMADRPIPVGELTLDRDVGLMLYSDRFLADGSPVAWRVGVFGGGGTNLTTARVPGGLAVARVELRPLGPIDDDVEGDLARRTSPALALGVALAGNVNTNRLRSTTGPKFEGGATSYAHGALDLVFKWRGFALQAEGLGKLASSSQIVSRASDGSERVEYTRSAVGFVTQSSYTFDPPFELVGRLSGLYAIPPTDPTLVDEVRRGAHEVGLGANYYVHHHRLKLQVDWIARLPLDVDVSRASHAIHAQLDVTF